MENALESPREVEVEVSEKARRRRYTAEYKARILREADGCKKPGEIGALLRREGLYSTLLASWRAARRANDLAALAPRKRGPKVQVPHALQVRNAELERENARLQLRAERAEALVELQKKVSELLGIQLPERNGKNS